MTRDIRQQIDNALTILGTQRHQARGEMAQSIAMAFDALKAAGAALDEQDEQLGIVTDPERDMAAEVQRLTRALDETEARATRLEQKAAMAVAEKELEDHLHAEDKKRMKDLEKKARNLDSVLMNDDAAFGRFMENALDEQDQGGKRKKG